MMNQTEGWMGGMMGGWLGWGMWFWPVSCLLMVVLIVYIFIRLTKK